MRIRLLPVAGTAIVGLALTACSGEVSIDRHGNVNVSSSPTVQVPSGIPTTGAQGTAWKNFLAALGKNGYLAKPAVGSPTPKATASVINGVTATFVAADGGKGYKLTALTKNGQQLKLPSADSPDALGLSGYVMSGGF